MGFFQRIGQAIKSGVQRVFSGMVKREPKEEKLPIKPERDAEVEALRRAVEMLIEANQHAGDAAYEQARQEALVYINKSQQLAGKGPTQSGNRRMIAERYMKKELSTPAGVVARKNRQLEIFNANFGFSLSRTQAKTVGSLMASDSFKKLMELYKEKYDIIIGMVGDQVEQGIDPVRIEQALDLWQQVGIEPDFSDFSKVTELSVEEFTQLREDLLIYNEESVIYDDFKRAEDISGILGRYITW